MDPVELNDLVKSWIAYMELPEEHELRSKYWPAVRRVMSWHSSADAETLWQFITVASLLELSDLAKSNLAAGPLEDLLVGHGQEYIDRVVSLAVQSEKFNDLLGGVWGDRMDPEVWSRIESARKKKW